jgi:hypothetical protein
MGLRRAREYHVEGLLRLQIVRKTSLTQDQAAVLETIKGLRSAETGGRGRSGKRKSHGICSIKEFLDAARGKGRAGTPHPQTLRHLRPRRKRPAYLKNRDGGAKYTDTQRGLAQTALQCAYRNCFQDGLPDHRQAIDQSGPTWFRRGLRSSEGMPRPSILVNPSGKPQTPMMSVLLSQPKKLAKPLHR